MRLSIVTIFKFGDQNDLDRTVSSILSQTIPPWEIVYVLSGVNSEKEIKFVNRLNSAKVFINADDSLYSAMNIGLSAVTGDALIFLNGGDQFFSIHSIEYVLHEYKKGMCLGFSVVQYYQKDNYIRAPTSSRYKTLRLPSHQGFVAPLPGSKSVNFQEDLRIAADSIWMEHLINEYGIVISNKVITKFQLGGVSNYPTLNTMRVRFRSQGIKMAFIELMKFILRVIAGGKLYYRIIYAFKYERISQSNFDNGTGI